MTRASAYPVPVEELVPRVRERADELGRIPSQNQIMTEFRVGVSKARAVLTALRESGFTPGTTSSPGTGGDNRRLHAVPDQDTKREITPEFTSGTGAGSGQGQVPDPEKLPTSTPTRDTEDQVTGHGAPVPTVSDVSAETPSAEPSVSAGEVSGRARRWQVLSLVLLSLPAFVAIWGGWVGLGRMTGFGDVELLPGIVDGWVIDSAITLPIGVEAYAAFALRVWLSPGTSAAGVARRFAMWSAFGALALGMAGQVAYHLMSAAGITSAPWQITTLVACLPVAVLGSGAALAHLMHSGENHR